MIFWDRIPVRLPGDSAAETELEAEENPAIVAAAHPTASVAWAALAEDALADDKVITAYAYARTGYHRGLDQLRRNGWKGFGPVPYSRIDQARLSAVLAVLAKAADAIGESDEYARCLDLLDDCDTAARAPNSVWPSGLLHARFAVAVARRVGRLDLDGRVCEAARCEHGLGLVEHLRRVGRRRQVRSGHVLARNQRPHVQVVYFGDTVESAQQHPA